MSVLWKTTCSLFIAVVCCLPLLLPPAEATGKLEIKFKSYSSDCEDNTFFFGVFTEPCDAYFKICIDKPGTVDFSDCYYEYKVTDDYEDTEMVTFTDNIGGIDNPRIIQFPTFQENRVMLSIKVMDEEVFSDEELAVLSIIIGFSPADSEGHATTWTSRDLFNSSEEYYYRIKIEYRAYCDAHYYTSKCDVYCRAQNDNVGHYSCDSETGSKVCHPGWEGVMCSTDIDECLQGPCFNGAICTNLPGSYECRCTNGFIGKNCDLISSQCHSSPCQNNGTCTGTLHWYSCTCPPEWTGKDCHIPVDHCRSNPCLNNGTCYGAVGHYTCECVPGWTGDNCATEVNACDSLPCQHRGTCTKRPRGEFECSCSEEYEGRGCEVLKNPCDSSPCPHDATCQRLSHQDYTCSCAPGWEGEHCERVTDPCNSHPCQNDGLCTQTNSGYVCSCIPRWKGDHCTTEVDPCDSVPCRNGGTCTKKSWTQFECSCKVEYEGEICESPKNPCRSNPCYHGDCKTLSHSVFECVCTKGWVGTHCDKAVLGGTSETKQDDNKSEKPPVPIILGCLAALLLLIIIIIAICFVKRRRPKNPGMDTVDAVYRISNPRGTSDPGAVYIGNPTYQHVNFQHARMIRTNAQPTHLLPPPYSITADQVSHPVKSPGMVVRMEHEDGGEEGEMGAVGGRVETSPAKGAAAWKKKGGVTSSAADGVASEHTQPGRGASGCVTATALGNDYASLSEFQPHSATARRATCQDESTNPQDAVEGQPEENFATRNDDVTTTPMTSSRDAAGGRVEPLDSSEDEGEGINQEDLNRLRHEVLQSSARTVR